MVLEATIWGSVAVTRQLGDLDLPLAGGGGTVGGELELGGVGGKGTNVHVD